MLNAINGKQRVPRKHVIWGFPEKNDTLWGGRRKKGCTSQAKESSKKALRRQGVGSGVQEQGTE